MQRGDIRVSIPAFASLDAGYAATIAYRYAQSFPTNPASVGLNLSGRFNDGGGDIK